MGCDVHMHVEYREPGRKDWTGLFTVHYCPRSYGLFGNLAGVRRDEAMFNPRGFPPDADYYAKEDFKEWGDDAHTPSWLTLEEFQQAVGTDLGTDGWMAPYFAVIAAGKVMIESGHEVRIVFWFDN